MSTDPMRLDSDHEWTGHWWLPEDPDHVVPGVLRYSPDQGLRLSLIGGFQDHVLRQVSENAVAVTDEMKHWPIILGVAENRAVTLLDCDPISSKSFGIGITEGPHKQTVSALTALVGAHIQGSDDEVFTSALVSVENLRRWASSSVFTKTIGVQDERLDGRGTISVKPTEEPSVVVDGTTITLAHEHTLPHFEDGRGQTIGRMKDTVFTRVRPENPISLDAAKELAKAMQDLVSLATHRACAILWLRLKMPPEDREYPEGYPVHDREVTAYFRGTVKGDADAKAVDHHDVLFNCEHIPFEVIVPQWWKVRQSLQAASNIILGLRYAPARYLETNLMTAVGAAEVLHRGLGIDRLRMPDEDFQALRATLLEHTPEEHREWLKGKFSNGPTLRERLLRLASLPDSEAMARLVPDVERWAQVASRARNDLAHEGETPKHTFDHLIAAMKVTTTVVILNLLQELGVPGERQREIVQDHPAISQTARQAAQDLVSEPT